MPFIQPDCWNDNDVHNTWFCTFRSAQQNDRKWKFPFISVLRYVKQMFSFWGFWNFCFQFVSFVILLPRLVLNISVLRAITKISRRRLWSLKRFYRDCRRLLSRLRHMRLSQGTLRRDLHGCSSLVIIYHYTFLILRGCLSPCHLSWWRRRHLRKGSSKNRKWQKWLWQKWLMTKYKKSGSPLMERAWLY